MRMFRAALIVVLAIGATAGQTKMTKEEYEIYGLVLTEIVHSEKLENPYNHNHYVIASKTIELDPNFEKRRSSLYRSFNNRNRVRADVERRFRVRLSYSIADEQEILLWAKQDADEFNAEMKAAKERALANHTPMPWSMCGASWKRFSVRFPQSEGYYQISRIGFSRDHRRGYVIIVGQGSSWNRTYQYWLKWTSHGWETGQAAGSFGVC